MANEFIARKGLVALDDSVISGSLGVSGSFTVEKSGSTVFEVVGSEGQLFSINDSMTGSLFAVSDVSGLPILEVFSDNKVIAGAYGQNTFVVNDDKVGVGISSPTKELHVSGSGLFDGTDDNSAPGFQKTKVNGFGIIGDRSSWYITNNYAGNIHFGVGGTHSAATKMTIRANGRVGIGTTSPSYPLHIQKGDNTLLLLESTDGLAHIAFKDDLTTDENKVRIGAAGNELQFIAGGSEVGRFDSNGRLGISFTGHTNNPSSRLHIFESSSGTSTSTGITIEQTGSGDSLLQFLLTNQRRFVMGIDNDDSNKFKISKDAQLDDSASFTIDGNQAGPNSKIGINTPNPLFELHVSGSGSEAGRILLEKSTNDARIEARTQGAGAYFLADSRGSDNYYGLELLHNATGKWFLGSYGDSNFHIIDGAKSDGNKRITIKDSNGYVGIGTSNPSQLLEVNGGNIEVNSGNLKISHSSANGGIGGQFEQPTDSLLTFRFDSDRFRFWAGGTERLTILSSSGNVGIGNVTSPEYALDIQGTSPVLRIADKNVANSLSASFIWMGENGNTEHRGAGLHYDGANNKLHLVTSNNGAALTHPSGATSRVTIQENNGNVGIGTSSPTELLHVNGGDIKVETGDLHIIDSHPTIFLSDTNHNPDFSLNVNSGQFKITDTSESLTRVIVNEIGNVGIGGGFNPTDRLHISGTLRLKSHLDQGDFANIVGIRGSSLIKDVIASQTYEDQPFINTETINAFAGADKWATSITASNVYGSYLNNSQSAATLKPEDPSDPSFGLGFNQMFRVGGNVFQPYFSASGAPGELDEIVIEIDHSNEPLKYHSMIGIQFTHINWRARRVKIEGYTASSDSPGWVTGLDVNDQPEGTIGTYINGAGSGIQKTRFTLGRPANSGSLYQYVRISKLFGYDFKGVSSADEVETGTYYLGKHDNSAHYGTIYPATGSAELGKGSDRYENIYAENLRVNDKIYHYNDSDTYIDLSNDDIKFNAGGIPMLQLSELNGDQDSVIINESSNDVDFRVEGNTDDHLLFTDAGTDKIGIGTNAPTAKLHISSSGLGLRVENHTTPIGNGVKLAEFVHKDGTNNPQFQISSSNNGIMLRSTFSTGINGEFRLQANGGSSYMAFDTGLHAGGGGEHMRLTSDGKLGVGTTAPQESITTTGNLLVTASATRKVEVSVADSSSKAQIRLDALRPGVNSEGDPLGMGSSTLFKSGAFTYFDTDEDLFIRPNNKTGFRVRGSGDIHFVSASNNDATTGTTYLFGDASERRVGIGTTTLTSETLTVEGNVSASGFKGDTLDISGSITADTLTLLGVNLIENQASVISGSNIFGNETSNIHEFTGSLEVSSSDITIESGSFRVNTFNEGLRFHNGTNYSNNRITLSTAENLQFVVGNVSQFYQTVEILSSSSLKLRNEGNAANIGIRNVGSGSGFSRLDIENSGPLTNTLMSVSSSGHVGVGTSDPDATLHVVGVDNINTVAIFESSDDKAFIRIKDDDTDSYLISKDSKFYVGANSSDYSKFNVNLSNGNVGIGTASPSNNLEIADSANPKIRLRDTAGGYGLIEGNDGNLVFSSDDGNTQGASKMAFKVDGSERMRIDSSGRVGIGTTSPSTILHVSGGTTWLAGSGSDDFVPLQLGLKTDSNTPLVKVYTDDDSNDNLEFHLGRFTSTTKFTHTSASSGADRINSVDIKGSYLTGGSIEVHGKGGTSTETTISANQVSSSITSTASFGVYLGDGSQLTGVQTVIDSSSFAITSSDVIFGNITGSTISASGDIIASNLSGTNTGDQNLAHLAITSSDVIFANITASGNISASNVNGNHVLGGTLKVEKSGSTIFEVVGDAGQLFSIEDGMSGSLFAVSDISGLPIFEVFSDDTIKLGSFNDEALIISGSQISSNLDITNNITSSGNISASGTITAGTYANLPFTAAGISGSLGTNATLIRSLTAAGISGSLGANASLIRSLTAAGISGSLGTNATLIRSLTAAGISGSLGTNATLIRSLTAAGISGSLGTNASLIRSLTAAGISGSLGTNATLIRSLTAAGISSSLGTNATLIRSLTAAGISGSLGTNATLIRSLTAAGISGSLGTNATLIRSLTAAGISGSLGTNATLIRSLTAAGISGSLGANATLIRSLTAAAISGAFEGQTSSFVANSQTASFAVTSSNVIFGNITGSAISSSGNLFASLSLTSSNLNTVMYDTDSGQFYYTGSYGGGGDSNTLINSSADLTAISESGLSRGDIVKFGNDGTVAGNLYYWSSTSQWTLANDSTVGARGGMLAIALGTNSDTDGMLVKGIATIANTVTIGSQVYMGSSNGSVTSTAPSTPNKTLRSLGHAIEDNTIYFNPSPDFIITK